MTVTYDWTRFTCKININSSIESVYNAWTIPGQLESWFLRSAEFKKENGRQRAKDVHLQPNDTYNWLWYGFSDDVVEKGKVILANDLDKLKFSFVKGAEVTINIGTFFNETVVMLTQEKMPDDETGKRIHLDCHGGWTFYLANLKSFLEGGIDLRNKNIELKNMVNS